jgi:hypothetical protein
VLSAFNPDARLAEMTTRTDGDEACAARVVPVDS